MASNRNLLVLPGDGIGPEVMNEVRKIIAWMGKKRAVGFDIKEDVVGGAALDKHGVPLSDDAMKTALEADAVLFGSVGGPKWDNVEFNKKPERGLLRLRKEMDLFANLRPAKVFDALIDASSLKPEIVKGLIAKRPFMSITDVNAYLLGQKLTQAQATELYGKTFVHVNLNTGTSEEIQLIPGAGARMAHEFEEYRPWKSWAQFDKEIGKYVAQPEVARLKQYVFIPISLNTATDEDILSIPGAGQRMVREFKEYRPWKTKAQFEKEIGKYVGAAETQRLWRYVVIQ